MGAFTHLIVVRAFSHPHEAHLACSALHAAGIEAVVHDANIVGAYWLYSNAVGGVKVLVHPDDAEAAREILDSEAVVRKADEPRSSPAAWIPCPRCGSRDVVPTTRGKRGAILSWLVADVPMFPVTTQMRCVACGHTFT